MGTGKTSLIALLCRELGPRMSVAVITNDIYTDEDARMLRGAGVLAPERIRGVETGACPHTAIRDDITANLLAIEDLEADFDPVDLVLVESGGDNLTATFSPALVDAQIFVLDVAGGGDVVRKGGPGISRADLLVVNKTDLAPYVGVDAELMVRQGGEARDGRPVLGLSRTDPDSVARLLAWVEARLLEFRGGTLVPAGPRPDGGARPRPRPLARLPPRTEPTTVSHTRLEVCRDPVRRPRPVWPSAPTGRAVEGISGSASCTPGPTAPGSRSSPKARCSSPATTCPSVCGSARGVRLDVVEPAGTVAFDMRGGSARWGVSVEVDDGGELVWRAEPFVVATGAVVERELEVALHGSGAAVLREVLVLGRVREAGGVVRQRLRRQRVGPAAARRGPRSRRRAAAESPSSAATAWSTR